MIRILLFFLVLFALAWGASWLADVDGRVALEIAGVRDRPFEVSLLTGIVIAAVAVLAALLLTWLLWSLLTSPKTFGRWRVSRRREKGYSALSRGLVAAAAGNGLVARRMSAQAGSLLPDEPLSRMLDAQTALLENRYDDARRDFETMAEDDETRLLGLRGLYLEAQRLGEREAAAHYAEKAVEAEPGTGWAVQALLRDQALHGEWSDALATLENNRGTGLFGREEFDRKKAVALTALGLSEEDAKPERARDHAYAAHKLAPDLVAAATLHARACVRLGDMKKAAKVLQTTWSREPHPDVAQAYANLRPGDSVRDRLARVETLVGQTPTTTQGRLALAQAAMEGDDFARAREVMKPVLRDDPSERACLLMADIEEAQHGDGGRVREWLARALRAPRDPVWVADGGIVSDEWKPASPVTGELDAFEWKVPVDGDGHGAALASGRDYAALMEPPDHNDVEDAVVVEAEPKTVPLSVRDGVESKATPKETAFAPQSEKPAGQPSVGGPPVPDAAASEESGEPARRGAPDDPGVKRKEPA